MRNIVEKCFALLMLIYLSSGLTGFLAGDSPFNVWRLEDNPLLLTIQTAMYAITLGLIALNWRKFMSGLRPSGWVLALALFALVSTLWSSDPSFTLRRSLVMTATTMFGIYFGSRYELRAQLRLLGLTFVILAALSAACALLLPRYGIDNQLHRGDWQGILGQKNLLGKAMAVGCIVWWSAKGVFPPTLRIAALLACAAVMLMSGSRAAVLVCGALLLIGYGYRALRARPTTLVPLAIIFLAACAGLAFLGKNSNFLRLALLNPNATLTRRTEIWTAVWTAISSHTWLGYGFSGFWAGLRGESMRVAAILGFLPRHAHNGFLDLWLELGLAGVLLFAAGYLRAVGDALRLFRKNHERLASWPLQYLAFMLIYHVAEGPILRPNSLYWAVCVAVVVSTARAVRSGPGVTFAMHAGFRLDLEPEPNYLPRRTTGSVGDLHPETGRSAA